MNATLTVLGPDGFSLAVDMSEVYALEARKDEVSSVTKARAPELMRAMERGYSLCGTKLAQVVAMVTKLEQAMNLRKAVVILDEAPAIIKTKGAGNNKEARDAILEIDSEYQRLQTQMIEGKSLQDLLKVKVRGFEMSFSAIKKVYDSTSNWGMDAGASVNVRGGGASKPVTYIGTPDVPPSSTGGPMDNTFGIEIGKAVF